MRQVIFNPVRRSLVSNKAARSAKLWEVVFLSAFYWAGCATYSTYTCPDPIGNIVRQDCDDYKVRYESLQASLSVSIGSVSVGGSLGHEQVRDPSELIQMMMHQTLALCHDYNACRVRNEEFSRRREQMDRTFTAVMAIVDQLKSRSLSESERKVLLGELVSILKPHESIHSENRHGTNAEQGHKSKSKWKSNPFRRVDGFWLQSKHLAPGGPAPGKPPKVIFVDLSSTGKVGKKGFRAYLWGKLSADDDIKAIGPGGYSQLCKTRIFSDQPLAYVSCKPKRDQKMPPLNTMNLSYTSGLTSQTRSLGPVAPIAEQSDSMVWLAFQPEPINRDPVIRERPRLVLVTRVRGWHQFSARCLKDDKPVKVGKSSVLKGQVSYNPYTVFQRYTMALPFTLPVTKEGSEPIDGDMELKEAKGEWKCKLKLDGSTVRKVAFRIGPDGLPELHRSQKSEVVSPWWLLDTIVVPNELEHHGGNS